MKATITGATGHLGGNLARALLARGHSVRAIVRADPQALEGLDVERVSGDVRDPASLSRAFRDTDVVFHAAARISIIAADRRKVAEANIDGTRNVLAACRERHVGRLVHFSSIEALDARPLDVPQDEDRPFVDRTSGSPYAVTKAHAEGEVRRAIQDGLDAVILNPTAIVGPFDFKPSFLGKAVMALGNGSFPMLIDGGFDWVDVRDVAEAAVAAAQSAPRGGRYIIGGRWASLAELAALACEVTGGKPPRLMCPYGLALAWAPISTGLCRLTGMTPLFTTYSLRVLKGNRNVSHERAFRAFGYSPRDLRVTLRDTIAWFKAAPLVQARQAQAM
jgi:dihydroflavonol-4-reductase